MTFMGRDQELKWLAFSLYPHSFFLYCPFNHSVKYHQYTQLKQKPKIKLQIVIFSEFGSSLQSHPLWVTLYVTSSKHVCTLYSYTDLILYTQDSTLMFIVFFFSFCLMNPVIDEWNKYLFLNKFTWNLFLRHPSC